MQLIDNKSVKAGDYLSEHISAKTVLSVVSSISSVYAFEILEEKLPFNDQDERKFRNRLTQCFVAQKCKKLFHRAMRWNHGQLLRSRIVVGGTPEASGRIVPVGTATVDRQGKGKTGKLFFPHKWN